MIIIFTFLPSLKLFVGILCCISTIILAESSPNDNICCVNKEKNGTCINCDQNVTYCCSNQPFTYNNTNLYKPFCCPLETNCCGIGKCCSKDEVCCSGLDSSKSICCKIGACMKNGHCLEENSSLSKISIVFLVGLTVVSIVFGIGYCKKIYNSLFTHNNSNQQQSSQTLQTSYQGSNNQNLQDSIFFGIPEHFLENFPIYNFEETENPKKNFSSNNRSSDILKLNNFLTEKDPLLIPGIIEDENGCTICLDSFVKGDRLRVLPCVHSFHVNCIDQWLKGHITCPLCKLNLLTQEFDY